MQLIGAGEIVLRMQGVDRGHLARPPARSDPKDAQQARTHCLVDAVHIRCRRSSGCRTSSGRRPIPWHVLCMH